MTAWVSRSSSPNSSSKSKLERLREDVAEGAQAPLQRDGRADVADVDFGRLGQQIAEGGAERFGVIDGGRGLDRDPPQLRRQRRRAVEVAALGLEAVGQHLGRVAVAPVLEHPREQLLDRLLGFQVIELFLGAGQHQPRLQLQQGGDQDEELGRHLQLQLALALEVLDVGDDDLAQLQVEEADLLAQDDRHQQVERPGEDVEVEIEVEVGYGHCGESSLHRGGGWRWD